MPGNYFMGGSQINPVNYNYPKMANVRGSQYANYPKFQETKNQNKNQVNSESANLAKELEKQIKELQNLTKEAKEIAKRKLNEEKIETISTASTKKSTFLEINGTSQNKSKKSNLDEISLDSSQKSKFDETIKNVINKLDNSS